MSLQKIPRIPVAMFAIAAFTFGFVSTPALADNSSPQPHPSPIESNQPIKLSQAETLQVIEDAKRSDYRGFAERRAIISQSTAFMAILEENLDSPSEGLDFFAAVSTREQAELLVANTRGKRFVVRGTESNPDVRLVDASPSGPSSAGSQTEPMAMPRCGKAWAAFSAWLAGTTMLCAPFSGPAAWGCAVAMGILGQMPDFNRACKN